MKIATEYNLDLVFDDSIFNGIIPIDSSGDTIDINDEDVNFWIFSPKDNWDYFYNNKIISIAKDYLGDPTVYENKSAIKSEMLRQGKEKYATTCKNASLEVWEFVNVMKAGDIVFAKEGVNKIIGKGTITSDFIYDDSKQEGFKYYRKIDWEHRGEWDHPGKAVTKTLTKITQYTDYVQKLNSLFDNSKCNIVVSHQEKLLRHADKILVLKNGEISGIFPDEERKTPQLSLKLWSFYG